MFEHINTVELIQKYGRFAEPVGGTVRASLFIGGIVVFLIVEWIWPLRLLYQSKLKRVFRNLIFGGANAVILNLTLLPLVYATAHLTASMHWGLLYAFPLPKPLAVLAGLLLMDYTFYWWHYWNHLNPFFWRFHNVHHIDLDMDVTTAARFHFGELLLSTFYRSAQLVLLGIDPFTWILFETLVVIATQFHHSNWKIPIRLESGLNKLIVTPRMHGIHHSIIQGETNSNFSTVFSFWDRLHGTLDLAVSPSELTIGVPAYRDPDEQNLFDIFLMPFRKQRAWALPNGKIPEREARKAKDIMLD